MPANRLGHHELLERLGQGSMGVVWKARDERSGEEVALKLLAEGAGGRRFRREFRAAQRLQHPNVVRVFEMGSGRVDGRERSWFTMELVEGGTLRELIEREAAGWPPERNSDEWLASRLSLMHQVALGLEHCHEHAVLHRDLKPTNVLVDDAGRVKLVDFGLARIDGRASSLSDAGQLIGTAAYMSPEQARGAQLDARSDLHGFGALLHELCCGKPPYGGGDLPAILLQVLFQSPPDPREANPELVEGLAQLIDSCLAKDPLGRPHSAAEVAHWLREVASDCGVQLSADAPTDGARRLRALAPQLVGRDREREALRAALERARSGPVVVTLGGPSGIGKTRLAEELRVDAELLGFHVLESRASNSPRPLGALRGALKQALRQPSPELAPDAALLTSVLPELTGRDDERGDAAPADRLQVAWAAEALLHELLAKRAHLLVLDDLQWADALSAQVVESLLAREDGALLIVASFREDEDEPRPAAARLRQALHAVSSSVHLRLAALDDEEVARVVESMLGKPPSARVASELRRATGGRPHDIEQVVRELAARGAVRVDGDTLALSLPEGVELSELSAGEATRSQLAGLGAVARRIVLAVQLASRGLPVTTLGEALELDEDELLDQLERLVGEGILRDGPGSDVVSLAHDRLREALSVGSSADELGSIRTSLARALERSGAAVGAHHRIAELDLAAGALEDARRTVPPSAEAFAAAGLHAPALERYEALITLAEQADERAPPETYKRRAELLAETGRTEDSVRAYAEIAEREDMAELLPPWAARRQQAFSLMLLTRHDEAIACLERAIEEARAAADASGEAKALSVLGTIVDRVGQLERSRELHAEAIRVARERGTEQDLAMALTNAGVGAYRDGRLEEASDGFREAAPLFEGLGDDLHASSCRTGLAAVQLAQGEAEAARAIAREALATMRRRVDVRGLSRALELVALAGLALGDVEEAETSLGEALAIRGRLGEPWAEGDSSLNLAGVAEHRCQWSRAGELLERARVCFEKAGDARRLARVAARRGVLAWRAEEPEARALLESARTDAETADDPTALLDAELALAALEADEGQATAGIARLEAALARTEGRATPEQLLSLRRELLACRVIAGQRDRLAASLESLDSQPAGRPALSLLLDALVIAAARAALGEDAAAARSLTDARQRLDRLAQLLPPDDRAAFVRQHLLSRLLALTGRPEEDDDMSTAERQELDRLRTFHSLVMASEPSEPDSLMRTFLRGALTELGFRRGLVFLSDGRELSCPVALDAAGNEIPPAERRVPDRLLRHALDTGEPVLSVRIEDDPELDVAGSVAELAVESFAAVPVSTEEGLAVVAYFDGPPPSGPVEESLRRLAPLFEDFGRLLERSRRVQERTERADALVASLGGAEGPIIGASRPIEDLRALIRTVAPTEASVLVLGENGTGKELVARELHAQSSRASGPMLARSCAELTETLLESELFGHEKGAFTGAARDRAGLFEAASGGTLFLDEVGEMPASLQAKLLRVLETGEVTRVGSTRSRKVDVRVVAATHRELAELVQSGAFRQDLYYRLKVIELRVPALRERREDLPLLAQHFLASSSTGRDRAPRGFTHEALRALSRHDWPGNVRELRNVIERAVILSGERDEIGSDLLPPEIVGELASASSAGPAVTGTDLRTARDAFERACIERALGEHAQNRTHAAKALGISLRSLQQKISRHGLS